jgi:hypothetical protein
MSWRGEGGVVRYLFVMPLVLLLTACKPDVRDGCQQTQSEPLVSPNGQFSASITKRFCKGEGAVQFVIVLTDARAILFRKQQVATIIRTGAVNAHWADDSHLTVNTHGGKRVGAIALWHDVRIAYGQKAKAAS